MPTNRKQQYLVFFSFALIVLFTIARIVYSRSFLLTPDEANYWQWSRHLAWGYHDQAPMLAWAIRFSTFLFGHNEMAVRLPSVLSMAIVSIYLVQFSRHWFGTLAGWQTAVLSQAVFVFNVGGLMATADGLQGAAWVAAAYHGARALETGYWRQWLASGISFGFGMLSKFTVVLFLPCILAFVIFTPSHRSYLKSIKPYLAYFIGGCLFIPVLAWNAAHNWNSLRHVAYIGGADKAFAIHLNFLVEFIGSQIGLLTPLVFSLIVIGWIKILRKRFAEGQWIFWYLFWTSFPIVAAFTIKNLHSRVYANWACFGYLTALVIISAIWSKNNSQPKTEEGRGDSSRLPGIWYWTVGTAYALTFIALLQVVVPVIPIPEKFDRIADETQGWRTLGEKVGKIHRSMPDLPSAFIFGLNYQTASILAFYVPGQPDTVSINRWNRPNVYDYWWKDNQLLGLNAVGCVDDPDHKRKLLELFDRVEEAIPVKIFRKDLHHNSETNQKPFKTFYIFRCFGFKGGINWVPPRPDDIRATS